MTLQVNRSNNKSQAVTGAAPFQKGLIHTGTNMYIFRHYYAPLKGTKKHVYLFFLICLQKWRDGLSER